MEDLIDYGDISNIIRFICLGIIFIWGFYRAFVTDFIIRRFLFAMQTFTTILFMTLTSDIPASPYRNLFYLNLAAIVVYDLVQEAKTERFVDAFRTVGMMRKKLFELAHSRSLHKSTSAKN